MSWKDCITAAVEAGRIKPERGDRAHEAYDRAYARALSEGMDEGGADLAAADAAVEEITSLNKTKRWQRVKEMQSAKVLHDRVFASSKPWEEVEAIIADLENAYDTTRGFAMANLDRMLMEYKPKRGGLKISLKGLDRVVRGAFGESVEPEYQEMADALQETMELLRKMANSHGADIPASKNRNLFQTHDAVKVSSVRRETWVDDHLREGVLDWEVMRYEGKRIDPTNRREILERVYRGIVTDGADRGLEAQGNTPNLATRLNRDRFLHYVGADAWLEMQEKYGAGSLYEQTIGMIDTMAKDISLMRVFGPNADSMKEFVKRVAEKRAGDLDLAKGGNQRKLLTKTRRQLEVFDDEYEIHARHTASVEGNLAVQTFSAIRTLAVGAKLGGVFIPSLAGDIANAKTARRMFNLPAGKVMRNYWKEFVPNKQNTAEAVRLGVIFENAISIAHSRQRYFGSLDGPHWARRFSDIVYRTGLAAHHTQVIRNSEGKWFLGHLADNVGKSFDELPFAPMLAEAGITPKDWDVMRARPLYEVRGATFLRPMDALEDAPEVAEKFGDLLQLYVRTAVPDITLRSRRAQGENIDPNSFMGQFVRSTTSLMSFPISIFFNQLRRIAAAPRVRDKVALGAQYFAWMTLGGAFITQAKALAAGRNPQDMIFLDEDQPFGVNVDFWGRAILNGGSLGILGDLVFNNININNSSYRPGDPTTELFKAIHKVTLDNLIDLGQGKELDIGADAYKLVDQLVPKLWYMKLAIAREFGDQMFAEVDPAGYSRRLQYEQEYEEGQWWQQDAAPEAPELETAFGG